MDNNLKNKVCQRTYKPRKYGVKKEKNPTSANVSVVGKNDEENDTKVFVFTPDMLKNFGVDLNIQETNSKGTLLNFKNIYQYIILHILLS